MTVVKLRTKFHISQSIITNISKRMNSVMQTGAKRGKHQARSPPQSRVRFLPPEKRLFEEERGSTSTAAGNRP